jgi:hypothetical protein
MKNHSFAVRSLLSFLCACGAVVPVVAMVAVVAVVAMVSANLRFFTQ